MLDKIKNSANDFLGQSASSDLIALYRFNDEVILLNSFTKNRVDLVRNINKINRHGSKTLLYNALYAATDLLNKTNSPQKAIIVFTDGKDEGSSITINDVIETARNAHIPIYCIAYNPKDMERSLSRISILTGGVYYNSNKKNISDIYNAILSTIKNQYVAEYKSMIEPDGKAHIIEVKLKYNNFTDTDQKEIIIKKQLPFIYFAYDNESLLLALITIFIIILIIFIVTLKNFNKAIKASAKLQDASHYKIICNSDQTKGINNTEETQDDSEIKISKVEKRKEISDLKAWLVERDGPNAGKKLSIQYEETSIGKSKDNDIIIDDRSAASEHAKIKLIKNSFYLFDMASGKGTFLNENKLLRPKVLYDWDEIKIGKKVYIFRMSNIA